MQSQTSDNSGFNKLKTILFLGLSCNYTTLLGCVVTYVLIQHQGLVSDWFDAVLLTISLMPFYMGDAVSSYVLGRINLEAKNDWDDIRMTPQSKERISSFYKLYRFVSIASSYLLAALILLSIAKYKIPEWLLITAIAITSIHFITCLSNILSGIAPIIPSYKKRGIIYRILFVAVMGGCWYWFFKDQVPNQLSYSFIFVSGILYFISCGLMHPLPSNGSLLGSILKESIINQSQSSGNDPAIDYTTKSFDIEDASIIAENTNSNVSRETEAINHQDEANDSVFPDAIIETAQETTDEQ